MEPILSNSSSKTCGETPPSNCIPYNGLIPSCIPVCNGDTVSDVFYKLGQQMCYLQTLFNLSGLNITGIYATGTGLTVGEWIPFSSSIPLSGVQSGVPGTIGAYSFTISLGGDNGTPMYKFTPSGDLLFRGAFVIQLNPSISTTLVYDNIVIGTIPLSSFPSAWNISNSNMLAVDGVINQSMIVYSLSVNYPSGQIVLTVVKYASTSVSDGTHVSLAGTQFNLA